MWSDGRFKAFITSTLRGAFRKYPIKHEVLKEAFVGKFKNEETGRIGNHFKCANCNGTFRASCVNVDHIDPVVDPNVGFLDWNTFIERLFCTKENLQVLCTKCHDKKTANERTIKTNANKKSNRKSRRKT